MKKNSRQTATTNDQTVNDAAIRARGGVPFLRAAHIKGGLSARPGGTWFELTGFNVTKGRDTDDEQVNVEVRAVDNEHYTIGVRYGSQDHRRLHHAFGADSRRWVGAVRVEVAKGSRGDVEFVNIVECAEQPAWSAANAEGDK